MTLQIWKLQLLNTNEKEKAGYIHVWFQNRVDNLSTVQLVALNQISFSLLFIVNC